MEKEYNNLNENYIMNFDPRSQIWTLSARASFANLAATNTSVFVVF